MPFSAEERAAAVRRARSAMRSLRKIDKATLAALRGDLAAARTELIARLATGSAFDRANAFTLLREVDRVAEELERRMGGVILGAARKADDLAQEKIAETLKSQGVNPLRVSPVLRVSDALLAESEAVADMVSGASDAFKVGVRTDLRRVLFGGLTLRDFEKRIGRALPGPGSFGTLARRAETIARNETSNVFALSQEEQRRELGQAGFRFTKTWVTSRDLRVRPSHFALDGTTVDQDEKFNVGGHKAGYPKDPALPPEESINCRCDVIEEFEKVRVPVESAPRLKVTRALETATA